MKKTLCSVFALVAATTVVSAQSPMLQAGDPGARIIQVHHEANAASEPVQVLTSLPGETWAFTQWQNQSIFDPGDNKLATVVDLLMDHDGKPVAAIIGVGGFLGVGERSVAVPFTAVQLKMKDQKWQLVMNATKDALMNAPAYKYDRTAMKWVPDAGDSTVGGGAR